MHSIFLRHFFFFQVSAFFAIVVVVVVAAVTASALVVDVKMATNHQFLSQFVNCDLSASILHIEILY